MKKNKAFFLIAIIVFAIIVLMYALKKENTDHSNTKEIISKNKNSLGLTKNQLKTQSDNKKHKDKKTDKKNININNVVDFNELLNNKLNPSLSNKDFVFNKERDDEIMRTAEKEIFSKAFQDEMMADMGFNKVALAKLDIDNPNENLLSTKDAPQELRHLIEKQLAEDKKRGYSEINDASMSKIINAIHYILGTYPIKSTTFSPANIPEYVNNNYYYLGYTFPGASYGDGLNIKHGTLWRLYQAKNASHIILLEESGHGAGIGGSYTFKETINESVLNYPAKYELFKSPNGQSFTLLNWDIKSYGFALHFIGLPNNNNKNILIKFGEELTKTNKNKDSALKLQ